MLYLTISWWIGYKKIIWGQSVSKLLFRLIYSFILCMLWPKFKWMLLNHLPKGKLCFFRFFPENSGSSKVFPLNIAAVDDALYKWLHRISLRLDGTKSLALCCARVVEWLHRISLGLDGTNEVADATSKQSKPRRQKVKSCKTDRDRLQSTFGIKQLNFQKNSKLWCHFAKGVLLSSLLLG